MSVRPEDDFYETPSYATEKLLERVEFNGSIWEPACGYGAISKVLEVAYPDNTCSSDLIDRGYGLVGGLDFLSDHTYTPTNIVTNPPFNLAEAFVRKALDCTTQKVAMFLRLAFLESQARKKLFEETPLQYVYVFSKRLTLYPALYEGEKKTSGGTMAFAWFVWNHDHKGEPKLRWL